MKPPSGLNRIFTQKLNGEAKFYMFTPWEVQCKIKTLVLYALSSVFAIEKAKIIVENFHQCIIVC